MEISPIGVDMRRKLDPTGVQRKPKGGPPSGLPVSGTSTMVLDKESKANLLTFVQILLDWTGKKDRVGIDE